MRGHAYIQLSDFSHIYSLESREIYAPSLLKGGGSGGWLVQPSGSEEAFRDPEEIPDSIRGNPLESPQICTLFTRYALPEDSEKSVPTRGAEGVETCRGEHLVELHRCSPHILWLH